MKRIKFRKNMQKKFLEKLMKEVNSPSLRELSKRIGVSYSTMKNYFVERRLLPENLFNDLCSLGKINSKKLNFKFVEKNWGQIKGGKVGRRISKKSFL
ncbi:MAG: hypothetical protein PVJ67_02600 [Candidatus Pacearchaeota archaeon]|jgi:hypothetical protein